MESRRVISEPTAASLAYGLHKKKNVEYIVVVDLGSVNLCIFIMYSYNHKMCISAYIIGCKIQEHCGTYSRFPHSSSLIGCFVLS